MLFEIHTIWSIFDFDTGYLQFYYVQLFFAIMINMVHRILASSRWGVCQYLGHLPTGLPVVSSRWADTHRERSLPLVAVAQVDQFALQHLTWIRPLDVMY